MIHAYNSQDGDTLYVPSVGEIPNFIIEPKRPSSGLFTLRIIAQTESKDALVEFFNAQQKRAAKDRGCVTAIYHLDGTSLELTIIEHQVKACAEGRRFEIIATMKDRNDRKDSPAIQFKRL